MTQSSDTSVDSMSRRMISSARLARAQAARPSMVIAAPVKEAATIAGQVRDDGGNVPGAAVVIERCDASQEVPGRGRFRVHVGVDPAGHGWQSRASRFAGPR
jgi:hypothetical protein